MKRFILLAFLLACSLFPAFSASAKPLVTREPQCATLVNTAQVRVYGTVRSNFYKVESGAKKRHEVQFRLEPQGEQQICSTGPFYEGYTVSLSLRTLMPVFECKTRLAGRIRLHADKQEDGGTKLYAECVKGTSSVSGAFQAGQP